MKNLAEIKARIPYEGFYFLIVPDIAAGSKGRYSIYRIPTSPKVSRHGGAKVIGRELSLAYCRKYVREYDARYGVAR